MFHYLSALVAISRAFWREGSPEQVTTWSRAFRCSRGFPEEINMMVVIKSLVGVKSVVH